MKPYFKGFLTGLTAALLLWAGLASAEPLQALFNTVAIRINGIDELSWGEELPLDNGATAPSSILYADTTYLPMRKIGELLGKTIYWNGDSKTVAVTDPQKDGSQTILTEQPDVYGNIWTYYLFETVSGEYYLGVKDNARGFERVYQVKSPESILVVDDGIYYARRYPTSSESKYYTPYKIQFLNNENTQDGEDLFNGIIPPFPDNVIFGEDNIFYYTYNTTGTLAHDVITVSDLNTMEVIAEYHPRHWTNISNLTITDEDAHSVTFNYILERRDAYESGLYEITFYKDETPPHFGEPILIRDLSSAP